MVRWVAKGNIAVCPTRGKRSVKSLPGRTELTVRYLTFTKSCKLAQRHWEELESDNPKGYTVDNAELSIKTQNGFYKSN